MNLETASSKQLLSVQVIIHKECDVLHSVLLICLGLHSHYSSLSIDVHNGIGLGQDRMDTHLVELQEGRHLQGHMRVLRLVVPERMINGR